MSGDTSRTSSSVRIARRVVARELSPHADTGPAVIATALQLVCARVCSNLRDAMGVAGCDALMDRARKRVERDHPALVGLCGQSGVELPLDAIVATVEAHGHTAVTAAIEALLAALIDILSRLIGEDMAIRLIDPEVSRSRLDDGAHEP
jgi:hypothetical protein